MYGRQRQPCDQNWLTANPLKRLKLPTAELLGRQVEGQFCRVEQKAAPMLLKSMGKELHEDIVASRTMSAAAIVYKVARKYQPGGSLVAMSGNNSSMVRAVEVGVNLPGCKSVALISFNPQTFGPLQSSGCRP